MIADGILIRMHQWLQRAFSERQIYVRSEGRVHFYTVGVALQATVAGLTAIFLGWVAFATVNVVFKDRIIAAEDHRFQRMQAAYENRIEELQVSYDDLNAAAARARVYADGILERLGGTQHRLAGAAHVSYLPQPLLAGQALPPVKPATAPERFAGSFFGWLVSHHPARAIHQPNVMQLANDTARLGQLASGTNNIMSGIEGGILLAARAQKQLIGITGISPDQFLQRLATAEGVGGPDMALDGFQLDGVSDRIFSQTYFKAEADLDQVARLHRAIERLPIEIPVAATVERTSGFGPRLDPFSGRYAFHPGVDFAGASGTPVHATAGGRVTFAGLDGGYGNMVELDHGFGLRTRYAHLQSVAVTKGQSIAKGIMVGRMGSTGRSTGPHVHYEVWYDNIVRNPDGFLRIGARREAGNAR